MRKLDLSSQPLWLLASAVVVLWVFVVVVGYYVVHKPFGLENAAALLRTALDLLSWLLLLTAATGLGRRAIGDRLGSITPLEDLVFSAGLGLGLLSLLTLALGLVGGFSRWLAWILIALIALSGASALRSLVKRLRSNRGLRTETRFERLLAGYVILILIPAFLFALAPPIAWDSQVYHLTGPRLYIEQGRITGGIDIPYLGFPALVEMLFAAGMLLRGPAVAKLIHLTYGVLSLLAIYVLADRYLTRRTGWLAMSILLSATTITLVASWAYVDLAVLFYELAAFCMVMRWREAKQDEPALGLVLAGAFCGFAMGVKYTAILLPVTLVVIIVLSSRKEGWRHSLRQGVLFTAATTLVAAPWFLRNWGFFGNPIYPFLLSGRFWDEFRTWFYSRPGTGLAYTAPWRLLTAPWEATIFGLEGAEGYSATIGPLFLLAIPLLLATQRQWTQQQRGFVGLAIAVCVPQYLFWLYGVAQSALLIQTRLLFPIFGLLALLAGFGLDRMKLLDRTGFSMDRLLSLVVLLVLVLDLIGAMLQFTRANPLAFLAGWQSTEGYLNAYQFSYQQAIHYINQDLPPQAKVYFLWEPRSYYSERDVRPDAILDAFLHLRHRFSDAGSIDRYLHDEGFTHVLLYRRGMEAIVDAGFDPVTSEDLAILQELQTDHWSVVGEWGDTYMLFELLP